MKITLKTAMYITEKIRNIERAKINKRINGTFGRIRIDNTEFEIKQKLAEYIKNLTDDEWLELKKQFERPQAY